MHRGLFTAGLYLGLFWMAYPLAATVAWVWHQWDRLQSRRHGKLMGSSGWYG